MQDSRRVNRLTRGPAVPHRRGSGSGQNCGGRKADRAAIEYCWQRGLSHHWINLEAERRDRLTKGRAECQTSVFVGTPRRSRALGEPSDRTRYESRPAVPQSGLGSYFTLPSKPSHRGPGSA